jgi:hypothetical protein
LLRIALAQVRLCLQDPKFPAPDGIAPLRLTVTLVRLLERGFKKTPREFLPRIRVKELWFEITLAPDDRAQEAKN